MRNSKIVALVATAALLVLGAAFTSFAATGWTNESGQWMFYGKDGEAVTEKWEKSGSDLYWLDEDGIMAEDTLVEDNGNYYYVDPDGKMVKNDWREVENTDDAELFGDTIWYYFQNSGRAFKASEGKDYSWKTVKGKKYAFDSEARMLFGWIDAAGMVNNENNDAYIDGIYYCGEANDGARVTSDWRYLYIDDDGDDANKWFFFKNDGAKATSADGEKKINGKYYIFDGNGIMLSEWVACDPDAASNSIAKYKNFNDPEVGARYTTEWFQAVPQASVNETDNTEDTLHWYYAESRGVLAKSKIKTIKSKQYGFNAKGEMVSGLQWVEYDAAGNCTFTAIDEDNIDDYISPDTDFTPGGKTGIHFFSDDEVNDGSMKVGSVKVDIGDGYTFKLGTKGTYKGVGKTGRDGNSYYVNGCKLAADGELKVQLAKITVGEDGKEYIEEALVDASTLADHTFGEKEYVLITSSGAIIKNGSKTDADGFKVTAKGGYVTDVEDKN